MLPFFRERATVPGLQGCLLAWQIAFFLGGAIPMIFPPFFLLPFVDMSDNTDNDKE